MKVSVTVPKKLSKQSLEHLLKDLEARHKVERALVLIDIIVKQLRKIKGESNEEGYVRLKASVLMNQMRNYQIFLKHLISIGVIEAIKSYVPGKRSMQYRIAPKYESELITEFILNDSRILRKFLKLKRWNHDDKKYSHVSRFFNEYLTFTDKAVDVILEKKNEPTTTWPSLVKYYSAYLDVQQGTFIFTHANRVGRIVNSIALMPKVLRQELTYKGERMVEVDISASHPLILASILTKKISKSAREAWESKGNKGREKGGRREGYPYDCIFEDVPEDVQLLSSLIEKGKFYQHIADIRDEADLRKVKREILIGLNHKSNDLPISQVIKEEFPTLFNFIQSVKREDHTHLSQMMMSIESRILNDLILKRITEELPDVPVYPIYDAVLTIASKSREVQTIMKEEVESALGITPEIKISGLP